MLITLTTTGTYSCCSKFGRSWVHTMLGRDGAAAEANFDEEAAALVRVGAPAAAHPRALVFTEQDGHTSILRVVTPAGGTDGHAEFRQALLAHEAGVAERIAAEAQRTAEAGHDCMEHAVQCSTDGPLGHGWECGICGTFLQAG